MRRTVVSLCFFGSALLFGCRNSNSPGTGGSGGDAASTTGTKGTSATGTGTTGAGGNIGCDGEEHTVAEITNGSIGPGTKVSLKGVVAMSEKFLVSSSTSCLWGVFVSAPGLTETGPNTGVVALSYGTPPMVPPGGGTDAFCPKQGQSPALPAGDKIPDDVKPGDVLDLVGVTAYFPNSFTNCDPAKGDPLNMVAMRQLGQVCSVTRNGTAAIPAPHVLTAQELDSMSSTTDAAFHDKWGGVKVRAANAAVVPVGTPPAAVDMYGNIVLEPGFQVTRKAFYWGYMKDACHANPVYSNPATTFTSIDGFHYLNFCSWGIAPSDRCGDYDPPSEDCGAIASCVGMP